MFDFSLLWYCLRYVLANFRPALRLFIPAFMVDLLTSLPVVAHFRYHAFHFFQPGSTQIPGIALTPYVPVIVLAIVLSVIMWLLVCTAWHRFVLVGEAPWSQGILPTRREGGYLLSSLLITLIGVGVLLLTVPVQTGLLILLAKPGSGMLWTVLFVTLWLQLSLMLFVIFRYSLVLPAIGIDGPRLRLRESWRLSKPYAKALFTLAVSVATVAVLAVVLSGDHDQKRVFDYTASLLSRALTAPLQFVLFFVSLTAVSLVYREATKPLDNEMPRS